MRVAVEAVGVLAPGLSNWELAKRVLTRQHAYVPAALEVPQPACLQPAERRRSSPTVRLAIAAAEQALQKSSIPTEDMAMVFSSYEAAGVITHQLCEALAGNREVSPTQFHNSVHNAPCGYYSIAMGAKRAASSVCRGEWSFAAGLLNAVTQVVADELPVLYVCYDSPLPSPMCDVMPVTEPTAIALILTPASVDASRMAFSVEILSSSTVSAWADWMPTSWHANASARGFAALELFADDRHSSAVLSLSPELGLALTRC